jgi:hypothetical protein
MGARWGIREVMRVCAPRAARGAQTDVRAPRSSSGWPVGPGLLIACLTLTGCSGSVRETAARETAQRFVQAIASGSHGIAGELLAPRARDPLASTSAGDCAASPAVARLPRAPVGTLAMWGEEAQARTGRDTLFLHEFSTGWLVTGAGCRPRNEQVYDCSVGGR